MKYLILFVFSLSCLNAASWSSPPFQLTTSAVASSPQISASGANHAVAVWVENGVIKGSIFINGSWQSEQMISNSGANVLSSPQVAMYAQGDAVAVWLNTTLHTIESAVYNGSSWSTVSTSFTSAVSSPTLSMNQVGGVILGYSTSAGIGNAAFFSGGSWGDPTPISSNNVLGGVVVAINPGGMASAIWETNTFTIQTAFYYGSVWGSPITISTGFTNFHPALGMDNLGNVQAIWISGSSLESSTFNGSTWTMHTTRDSSIDINFQPILTVALSGVAAAVWISPTMDVLAANYLQGAWGAPITLSTTPAVGAIQPQATIDPSGNVYVIWPTINGGVYEILSVFYTNPTTLQTVASSMIDLLDNEQIAVSPNNSVFAIWQTDVLGIGDIFSSTFTLAPLPPQAFSGNVIKNRFLSQTDRIHKVTWVPASDNTVTNYILMRNGQLLATISALGPYTFSDHNRSKNHPDVYAISSINGGGVSSPSLTLVLQ